MTKEAEIEQELIGRLTDLKYTYRENIRDKQTLELNFRQKFEALNKELGFKPNITHVPDQRNLWCR